MLGLINNEDHKTPIKAKMEVTLEEKNKFKHNNLIVTTDMGILKYA
jgi:hypothetical protein